MKGNEINQTEKEIADEIVENAMTVKRHNIEHVTVSLITDRSKYRDRVEKVNDLVRELCIEKNLDILEHDNITLDDLHHGLHIDYKRKDGFISNFYKYINSFL